MLLWVFLLPLNLLPELLMSRFCQTFHFRENLSSVTPNLGCFNAYFKFPLNLDERMNSVVLKASETQGHFTQA